MMNTCESRAMSVKTCGFFVSFNFVLKQASNFSHRRRLSDYSKRFGMREAEESN